MNLSLALFVLLGFLAVVLLLEGLYVYWNDTKSPEVRRVEERLRAISAGGQVGGGEFKLLRQRLLSESPTVQRLLGASLGARATRHVIPGAVLRAAQGRQREAERRHRGRSALPAAKAVVEHVDLVEHPGAGHERLTW